MTPRRPFEEPNVGNIGDILYQLPPDIKMTIMSDSSLSKYPEDDDEEDDEDNYDYINDEEYQKFIERNPHLSHMMDDIEDLRHYRDMAYDIVNNQDYDDEEDDEDDYDEENDEYYDDILYNPDYVFLNPYRSYGLRYDKLFLFGNKFRNAIKDEIADTYIDSIISRMLFLHFLEAMLMEINIYSDSDDNEILNILITIPDYNKLSYMDVISDNINNVLDEYADIYDYQDRLSYMDFIINDENLTGAVGKTLTPENNNVLSQNLIEFVSYGLGYLFSTTDADEKFDKDSNKYILHWRILRREEDIENPLNAYGYTEDEYIKYTTKLLDDISNKDTISNSINNYINIGKRIGIFHEDYTYDKI